MPETDDTPCSFRPYIAGEALNSARALTNLQALDLPEQTLALNLPELVRQAPDKA